MENIGELFGKTNYNPALSSRDVMGPSYLPLQG